MANQSSVYIELPKHSKDDVQKLLDPVKPGIALWKLKDGIYHYDPKSKKLIKAEKI